MLAAFGLVYYLNSDFYRNLFDFTATANLTSNQVFMEKIPYFVFLPFTIVLVLLCIIKSSRIPIGWSATADPAGSTSSICLAIL